MKFKGSTGEYFEVLDDVLSLSNALGEGVEGQLSIIWFLEDNNEVVVDDQILNLGANQLICLTEFHKIEINKTGPTRILRFNSPFYCILDHDSEVGCKGILFFGASNTPVLIPSGDDLKRLLALWPVFLSELESKDEMQLEMLQMLLKRLLILCTRIYKSQENYKSIDKVQIDIIREFNFLVEQNFKSKHTVGEYASLLNKSPKTLSNLFGKLHNKSPLQLIQDRIMLEARRLLRYTEKPISEIGYDIGFNDIQSFSRFFKKHESLSPSDFRIKQ